MKNKEQESIWNKEKAIQIANIIRNSDRILVGLGGGFTTSAGVDILPLDRKIDAGEYWKTYYPYIKRQTLNKTVPELYTNLYTLLKEKDYFIIDSNSDSFIYRSGLDLSRIYKIQGEMARMQCNNNCKNKSYIGKRHFDLLEKDIAYLPLCPDCGEPLVMNVYTGKHFCEEPYLDKKDAYFRFINSNTDKSLALLELGVGYTMPELIRFPFEHIVMNHPNAALIRINTLHPLCVEENRHKAVCAGIDIAEALREILDILL